MRSSLAPRSVRSVTPGHPRLAASPLTYSVIVIQRLSGFLRARWLAERTEASEESESGAGTPSYRAAGRGRPEDATALVAWFLPCRVAKVLCRPEDKPPGLQPIWQRLPSAWRGWSQLRPLLA